MSNVMGFIGGGNMASSIIVGLLANAYLADNLWASVRRPEHAKALRDRFALHVTEDNLELVREVDVIILSVKPQQLRLVCDQIKAEVARKKPLVISVAAGATTEQLHQWLGGHDVAIVRAMPNTPSAVGAGAAGLYANSHVSAEQKNTAESILRAVGLALWVDVEEKIDAVAAVSGSGPAYLFLVMEAMERAGKQLGLSSDQAGLLVRQTVLGSARMALETGEDVVQLRRAVTSPGGTTQEAISVLEQGGLLQLFESALEAAKHRAKQMSEELS